MNPLLEVDGLTVGFPGRDRDISVVRECSLKIDPGEFVFFGHTFFV